MRSLMKMVMVAVLVCGCVFGHTEAGEKLSGKKLIVGTMANCLGLPVRQAQVAGYFDEVGLDVEILIFATGAPINEAMSAQKLDMAVSGMATVHALATGRFTYIGDGMITIGGETIYARPDSIYAKTEGPRPNLYGNAEIVKGARILGPLATAAQFNAIKYVEALGLTADDFDMVGMDYAGAQQAFITGEGDLVASSPPYSNQLDSLGYFPVSDLYRSLGITLVDANYCQNYVLEERRADLVAFLECYYRASEDLNNDPEMRRRVGREWYSEEGRTVTDKEMDDEIRQKSYNTLDTLLTPGHEFGDCMVSIGQFFTEQGMIRERSLPNVQKSMDPSLIQELKAKWGKQ
ncbi:MAG: hypothetical protein LUC93_00565 [Planctomycetaceae bacterium]|nr:hypothetical protein [Planctomycetaceae bacterium]